MTTRRQLNMDKIAKALGSTRRGTVKASSGHFGATALAADVQARFRAPPGGGRSTDPSWKEKRLVSLAPETLTRLEHLAELVSARGSPIGALQVAALLLERATQEAETKAESPALLQALFAASKKRGRAN